MEDIMMNGMKDGLDDEVLGEVSSFKHFLDVADDNGFLLCIWHGVWQDRLKSVHSTA
jgi:hypothetical protein